MFFIVFFYYNYINVIFHSLDQLYHHLYLNVESSAHLVKKTETMDISYFLKIFFVSTSIE